MSAARRQRRAAARAAGPAEFARATRSARTRLDTEGVTQRVTTEDQHNSTGSRFDAWSGDRSSAQADGAGEKGSKTERKAGGPSRPSGRVPLLPGREGWVEGVGVLTTVYRKGRAAALRERGRQSAKEKRAEWARPELDSDPDEFVALARATTDPIEREQCIDAARAAVCVKHSGIAPDRIVRDVWARPLDNAPLVNPWHEARAEGKLELFNKVKGCSDDGRRLHLRCRECGTAQAPVPMGCAQPMFCKSCRERHANRFRVDFQRKRLGLVQLTRSFGLMARGRRRARGGRFGERMITLTLPDVGTVAERVERLRATWARFWRLFSEWMRPRLAPLAAGIRAVDPDRFHSKTGELRELRIKGGRDAKRAREAAGIPDGELSLWDLVSYLWVLEWTPGRDGFGHPHLHAWLFCPYVPQWQIQRLWAEAFADVTDGKLLELNGARCGAHVGASVELGGKRDPRWLHVETGGGVGELGRVDCPIVDVRAVHLTDDSEDVAKELVKYLLKDWEVTADGARRVPVEVFAQLYTTIEGRRLRQSSSGLSRFALEKFCACPACHYEDERGGHWAFVAIEYKAAAALALPRPLEAWEFVAPCPPATGPPSAPGSRAEQLSREYWERRDREWSESVELRMFQGRWARMFPELVPERVRAERRAPVQGELFGGRARE